MLSVNEDLTKLTENQLFNYYISLDLQLNDMKIYNAVASAQKPIIDELDRIKKFIYQ